MSSIGWFDCGSGASGDMMLGALVDAGIPLEVLGDAVSAVAPERVSLRAQRVTRNGLAATRVYVEGTESHHHRTWADVARLLDAAGLDGGIHRAAHATFRRLAEAEARVHDTTPDEVHFHEVGALDAIADVVGACAGLCYLGLDALQASPVAVGSGSVRAAHGRLPVPVPAVVELFAAAQVPCYAGDDASGDPVGELCTPTGAALLTAHVDEWGSQPPMRVRAQGFGAGSRDLSGRPNTLRLLVGEALSGDGSTSTQLVLQTNVDDLDPRLWSGVLQRLLDAGAADAWLTPILMKKGRPAHTLAVLAEHGAADRVRQAIFAETSAIGLREQPITKHALARATHTVQVDGHQVRVKAACAEGTVVNVQPEYDDIVRVADLIGQPVRVVLTEATVAARHHFRHHFGHHFGQQYRENPAATGDPEPS